MPNPTPSPSTAPFLRGCLLTLTAATLGACPSEVPDQQNFAGVDAAASDQGGGIDQSSGDAEDSQVQADTAVTEDGQIAKDQVDTYLPDGAKDDSGAQDIGPADISPADSNPTDVKPTDVNPGDTGAPQTCANDGDCSGPTAPCQGWQCSGGACFPLLQNSGPCDDGNACTSGDVCFAGNCQAGAPTSCDDKNPCTTDSCAFVNGCGHTPLPDGSDCGGGKTCSGGSCGGGVASGVSAVGAGGDETCAIISSSGKVFCWGDDKSGQLGSGSTQGKWMYSPQAVANLSGANQVDCGGNHCCAVTSGGLYCWGNNEYGQVTATGGPSPGQAKPMPTPVKVMQPATKVAVGLYHSCALDSGGTVRCWGLGSNGQLGDGGNTVGAAAVVTKLGASAIDLDCGNSFCCAVLTGGAVSCWGLNTNGQLGLGMSNTEQVLPQNAKGVVGASKIATGGDHACALVGGGKLMCWGLNNAQQTGRSGGSMGQLTPANVPGLNGATAIGAGGAHTCAMVDGKVLCWGDNGKRQSAPASASIYVLTPTEISVANPAGFSLGEKHTCVRTAAGALYCWGANNLGQIGNGTDKDVSTPLQVQ